MADTPLSDDVVERCVKAMALREWPSDDPKDPIRWPDDFSERERETYHILARAALEAARYWELIEAVLPFANSVVLDPNKQRGDRHWATCGKLTNLDDVLRLKALLSTPALEQASHDPHSR